MSIVSGTLGKVAAVLAAGLLVSAAGVGAALSTGVVSTRPPTVESVESEWGDVSSERTGIETTVVVTNPNGVGVPGVAGVSYDVAMNDVIVAEGSTGGVSLSPGRNELALDTHVDNDKIPAWWASHINNGERTTVSIRPSVKAGVLSKRLPAQNRTFETDMLSSFERDSPRSFAVGNRTLLTVERTDASWGRATADRTPLRFSGTVHNPNGAPIRFARLGYEVSMNGVTVAAGTTDGGVDIAADSTETVRVNASLNNGKLDEWWVSHLRNDETTTLNVSVFAVAERDSGTERVPLPFLSQRVVFETDILGGGATTTRVLGTGEGIGVEPPRVLGVRPDWSRTDAGTRFSASVVVDNPNPAGSPLGEVALDAEYRVALNDVTLVDERTRTTLGPGRTELAFGGDVSDQQLRQWWVSHVENGERTALTVEARALADLGFAEVPVALPEQNRTFETDMLAGFAASDRALTVRGRRVGTLRNLNATWGDPTASRTPMVLGGAVRNERSRSLTVERFGYEVRANDVVLADDETRVGVTIPGGATRRLDATAHLDTGKIPAWWESHLARGERTAVSVSYYVVVEYRGDRYTVELAETSYTVETNALGDG